MGILRGRPSRIHGRDALVILETPHQMTPIDRVSCRPDFLIAPKMQCIYRREDELQYYSCHPPPR